MKKTHDYIHHFQRLLVRRWQVPHKDLPRGRASSSSDLLAAAGQRQHLRDQHGRVPGGGGHRGTRLAHASGVDRELPEHEGEIGEYSLVKFSSWVLQEVCLGGVWRYRVGSPRWSPLRREKVDVTTSPPGRGVR